MSGESRDISLIKVGEGKAAAKLIEAISSGVGAIWGLRTIIPRAKAEAKAQKIELKNLYELEKIRIQQESELAELRAKQTPKLPTAVVEYEIDVQELAEEPGSTRPLLERARDRFHYQEAKRQINIERIATHAMNELPPEVSEEPVDEDWIARFFDAAKDVSSEQMQLLWGKLLVGEVAKPGSYTQRTLEILRNMTSAEATLFTRLGLYVLNGETIAADALNELAAFTYDELLTLQDCHLLNANPPVVFQCDHNELCYWNKSLRFAPRPEHPQHNRKMYFTAYRLTLSAIELLRLQQHQADSIYVDIVGRIATSQGLQMTVSDR